MKLFEITNRKPWENPNFAKWFGDSKVVDEHGEPLVLFHGTAHDFDAFGTDVVWASLDPEFASEYADLWAWTKNHSSMGSNVIPVYMKVERPFNADYIGHTTRIDEFLLSLLEQAHNNGIDVGSLKKQTKETWIAMVEGSKQEESGPVYETHNFWYKPDWYFGEESYKKLRELFFSLEFDGIVYSEISPVDQQDVITWGTFYPNNVKSVIGNTGGYDTESPQITENQKK